ARDCCGRREPMLAGGGDFAEHGTECVVRTRLQHHGLAAVARIDLILEKIAERRRHRQRGHVWCSLNDQLRAAAARSLARRTIGLSPATGVDGAAAITLVASARAASASSTERRSSSAEMPLAMASAASTVMPSRAA